MTIEVRISNEAQTDIADLDGSIRVRVRKVVERLHEFPNVAGAFPYRGKRAGQFKVIVAGDWRLVFVPRGTVVIVIEVKHRSVIDYD